MQNQIEYAAIVLAAWNIIVFTIYGVDKSRAKHGARRIRERTLLLAAAALGAPGALIGMYAFRHKTKHAAFKAGVPLLLVINILVIFALYYFFGLPFTQSTG